MAHCQSVRWAPTATKAPELSCPLGYFGILISKIRYSFWGAGCQVPAFRGHGIGILFMQWVTEKTLKKQGGPAGQNRAEKQTKHTGTPQETTGQTNTSLTGKPNFPKKLTKRVNFATDFRNFGDPLSKRLPMSKSNIVKMRSPD